jgi:hypothetical protein
MQTQLEQFVPRLQLELLVRFESLLWQFDLTALSSMFS